MTTIEDIKTELREIIELSDKATPAPWSIYDTGKVYPCPGIESGRNSIVVIGDENDDAGVRTGVQDATLIATSRNLTPKMAKALLTAIISLEALAASAVSAYAFTITLEGKEALETIRREWEVQA
jgi:hypothetical protein